MTPGAWTSVSFAATVLFGILSVFFFVRSRRNKRLRVRWSAVELQTKRHPEIDISFRGKPVQNLSRVRFALWNAGSDAIRDSDLPEGTPPRIILNGATTVLSVDVPRSSSNHIAFTASQTTATEITLSFKYLNPQDGAVVEILFGRNEGSEGVEAVGDLRPIIDAPIVGAENTDARRWEPSNKTSDILSEIVAVLSLGLAAVTFASPRATLLIKTSLVLCALVILFMLVLLANYRSLWKLPAFAKDSFQTAKRQPTHERRSRG